LDPSIKFLSQVLKISHIRSKKSQNIGQANASFVYRSDLGIDIEVIITGSHRYYADLFTTTGSKTHVNSILDILEDNDIDIFNYNLASEEHIYQLAGLQFVPCELREGLKEIEWAQQYKIPRLVALPDIKGDLHVHSPFSDGLISEKDLLDTIKKYNYQYLALTDHSPSNIFGNGLDQKRLAEKLKWFQNLKLDIGDSRILFGAEVDIKEQGRLDYQDQVLKSLEVVVASMHSSFRQGPAQNTQKATAALAHPSVDFLGHPTGIVFGSRAPYSLDMEQIIQQAGKFNKALEINSYFLRLDLNEHYARKAKEAGVLLVINTDSHRPNNLDHMRLGVDIARRAGLSKQDVLNTRDYEGFKQWKKER
jgi:DNA polymerase (family 10)